MIGVSAPSSSHSLHNVTTVDLSSYFQVNPYDDASSTSSFVVRPQPLGMLLVPWQQDQQHNHSNNSSGANNYYNQSKKKHDIVLVAGWEKLPDGKFGPIQKSGAVRLGDQLVRVNHIDITHWLFEDVMVLLRKKRAEKTLQSLSFYPFHREKRTSAPRSESVPSISNSDGSVQEGNLMGPMNNTTASAIHRKRYMFGSSIISVRVKQPNVSGKKERNENNSVNMTNRNKGGHDEEANQNSTTSSSSKPYAEYQIKCHLIKRGLYLKNEEHQTWSVWKRYSEFEALYVKLKEAYGWQLSHVEQTMDAPFPVKTPFRSYLFQSLSESFLETRRSQLNKFWQSMLKLEEIIDYAQPHRYSRDLAAFLSVEQYLLRNPPSPPLTSAGAAPTGAVGLSRTPPLLANGNDDTRYLLTSLTDAEASADMENNLLYEKDMGAIAPSSPETENPTNSSFSQVQKSKQRTKSGSRRQRKEQMYFGNNPENRIKAKSPYEKQSPGVFGPSIVFRRQNQIATG